MRKYCCLSIALAFGLPALLSAQEPRFMRVKEQGQKVTALEIAITHYAGRGGRLKVDLVGVVHVADRPYYRQLDDRLAGYDVVLYELVAPPGTKVPKVGKKSGLSGLLGSLMTSVLDLDSQLQCIDYSRKNFVHADLSFDAMLAAARARGQDGWTLGLSILGELFRKKDAGKPGPLSGEGPDFAEVLANPNLLKREMARQMTESSDLGPVLQALLVADRNRRACEVLGEQIAAGKKRIAIFYGAAHMPDFDRRLREDFTLERQGQEWLTAWDLRDERGDPALRLKSLLEKALEGK